MPDGTEQKDIRVMVLAAGFGSRMQKAGETTPKPLVKLRGRPLISYPLALLHKAGFNEVVINLHHRADEIQSAVGSGADLGLKIKWLYEPEILGTGGGIRNANRIYPAKKWLTINADTVIDLDLKKMLMFHNRFLPHATIVLCSRGSGKFNPIFADSLGMVRKIGEFPGNVSGEITLSKYAYCGVQIVSSKLLEYLPEGFSKMMEDGYFKALGNKNPVLGFLSGGLWLTFDEPSTLSAVEAEYGEALDRLAK